jgi:hypothetical protein
MPTQDIPGAARKIFGSNPSPMMPNTFEPSAGMLES